jgi:PPPDE putative peptidase domain
MRNWFGFLIAALLAFMPVAARADILVGFYSYDLDVGFVTYFPHAFVTLKGKTKDGRAVDENIGFTAKSVSPAVLMGSVTGVIEVKDAKYITKSDRQFEMTITDAQYDGIKAIEDKWRKLPGKSYNLSKSNCIHFVADVATYLGLKVDVGKAYVKKPKAFMQRILVLNPTLIALMPPEPEKKKKKA